LTVKPSGEAPKQCIPGDAVAWNALLGRKVHSAKNSSITAIAMIKNNELILTQGIEFWFSHYYNVLHNSGTELTQNEDDRFCEQIVERFNSVEEKHTLCQLLHDIVSDHFQPKLADKEQSSEECFTEVKYKKEEKYIRFPDLKVAIEEKLTFRIDINPCLAGQGQMTKIYCNAVLPGKISKSDAISFLTNAQHVCSDIVSKIALKYFEYFNEYFNTKIDSKTIIPYKLISCVLGSDDMNSKNFILFSKDSEYFKESIRSKSSHRNIVALLQEISAIVEPKWSLNEYEWKTKEVQYGEKTKEVQYGDDFEEENRPDKVNGYLGFKGNDEKGIFIGLSDAKPRHLLLPIHVNIIHAN
jgi:hypothetical protein